ncbi:hypothetical protein A3Q56_08232, partial [Intoshia linei]
MEKLIPKLKPLISEDGKYTSDPHVWIQRFENILVLTMPDDQKITDKKKCTLLKLLNGEIAEKRSENSDVTESYVLMKKKVLSWHKLNVSDKRDKFTNTFQGSNETIEAYIDRLNNLTTYCKFVDRKEKIRDQLVRGIKNRRAVEEIKMYDHLALDKCINIGEEDNQVNFKFILDTGSDVNCISYKKLKFCNLITKMVPVNDILKSAQGSTIYVYGVINILINKNITKFYVINTDNILRREFVMNYLLQMKPNPIFKCNAIVLENLKYCSTAFLEIVKKFEVVFSNNPGRTNIGEHSINLKEGSVVQSPHYLVPFNHRNQDESVIKSMVEQNIIEPSQNSYRSSCFFVNKKDGHKR